MRQGLSIPESDLNVNVAGERLKRTYFRPTLVRDAKVSTGALMRHAEVARCAAACAGDLSPAPPLPDPARDRLRIGPGLVAQVGGLPGEQFVKLSLGHALEDADNLGQQVSPACRELASSATAAASSSSSSSRHLA